jgi:hypothetical protein
VFVVGDNNVVLIQGVYSSLCGDRVIEGDVDSAMSFFRKKNRKM